MRTEFSGVGTAEYALQSAGVLYNKDHVSSPITFDFKSTGDWAATSRKVAELNHPGACRFGDILGLAPPQLRSKLEELLQEKVRQV